eukprot:Rhum_TRINITY_DN21615_c0_g2::Rhum_TRINITY_DN21615_c0_g2_i1::g.174401::m.174401/K09568/FKBP1; FK506-binding protein 1
MGGSGSKDASKDAAAPSAARVVDLGVTIETLKKGEGRVPRDGQPVSVHYTGALADGTVFDSSRGRQESFEFRVGRGDVVRCWDKAFPFLLEGERARITCDPEVAYGSAKVGPIPPNSTLVYDVEVLKLL